MAAINYQDMIRFRTEDGRYLGLKIVSVESGDTCWLTVFEEPNEDCNFLIRDWDYDPVKAFPFSGNLDADTPDCHGNFRMCHFDKRPIGNVGNDYVLSMNTDNDSYWIYWGISWDRAYDLETFLLYDANSIDNDNQIYDGAKVKIRNMVDSKKIPGIGHPVTFFLKVGQDPAGNPRVYGAYYGFDKGDVFTVEKVQA